ncbi:MAG: hypothetical protein CVT79_16460 [Alphaproteobacteria bacterium HGW-Alphaproteobacteria-18]|nr:MAG: hypothetical protein CVT79_16460 [Alphaproteobacteria bacterium HGW-Alphaproteobacteria-18]
MSKDSLGDGTCYICKAPLAPLVSICWKCGYSQLPNPQGDGKGEGSAPKPEPDLKKRLDLGKADFKAGFKKK